MSLRSHMKHSFHVFHHGIKTTERDKRLVFASAFICFSCFQTMMKYWTSCFLYYVKMSISLCPDWQCLFCGNYIKIREVLKIQRAHLRISNFNRTYLGNQIFGTGMELLLFAHGSYKIYGLKTHIK